MVAMVGVVLAALYLRGFGAGCPRRRWPLVVGALQAAGKDVEKLGPSEVLRRAGLEEEAYSVRDPMVLERASALLRLGRVVTVGDEGYPERWRAILGASAPPALWSGEGVQGAGIGCFAIVGSREPNAELQAVVRGVVAQVGELGFAVVSGGARGVDRWASSEAKSLGVPCLELLPVARAWGSEGAGSGGAGVPKGNRAVTGRWLSLNPASAKVSTAALMERNSLIFAAAEFAAVFQPRFRAGGTWHGASEALRRRMCGVLVHRMAPEPQVTAGDIRAVESFEMAARALVALGGSEFSCAEEISEAMLRVGRQPVLPLAESW